MFECHIVENMFNMVVKFLDTLYNRWCNKLIRVLFNAENMTTSRHSGFVMCIAQSAFNKVLCIWCAPHPIDIVVKASTESILDDSWIKFAYSWSVFLRSQDNLIIAMNIKCPKKTNRWVHLGRLLKFFQQSRHQLIAYTIEKSPADAPSSIWWVITYLIALAFDAINVTFVLF